MSRVPLGTVTTTPAAAAALARSGGELDALLRRHQDGEWGETDDYRRSLCNFAADNALPVVSRYVLPDGEAVVLITAADRSATRAAGRGELTAVEVSTAEGYALWSKTYDTELNQLIVVEQTSVDRILSTLTYRTVLDAATGTGRHALALARQGAEVTAFDTSEEMLAVAKERAQSEGLPVRFVDASLAQPLPFASETFDLVLCGLVFCHLPDIAMPCREFARVTRPGGHLILTDFHPDAFGIGWRTAMWQGTTAYGLENHQHTRAEYVAAVADAGFVVREVQEITMAEIPNHASHPGLRRRYGHVNFCLVVHGEKR